MAIVSFDFDSYMESLAEKLVDISHDTSSKKTDRFHRCSGITNLEEILQNITSISGMQLIIQDNLAGGFSDGKSNNVQETPYYNYFLLKKAKAGSMPERKAAVNACKAAMKKILARMRYDKLRDMNFQNTGLLYFDINTVRYDTIGPLADSYFGVWCSFTLTEPALLNINRADWTDGAGFDSNI